MDHIEKVLEELKEKMKIMEEEYHKLSHTEAMFHMPGHHVKHFLKMQGHSSPPSENKSFFESFFDGFHLTSKVASTSDKDIEINHCGICTDPENCTNVSPKTGQEIVPDFPPIATESHEVTMIDTLLDTLHLKPPDAPTAIEEQVMKFHRQADEVQKLLRSIQHIVLCKYNQKLIRKNVHGRRYCANSLSFLRSS